MAKRFLLHCFVSIIMLLSGYKAVASITIPVSNNFCNYIITVPEGWDTIPQSILKEKLKHFPVERGVYPVSQEDYFSGNYSLISFIPTEAMLNKFTFNQILSDITRVNNESKITSDTLQVHFKSVTSFNENDNYSIQSYFSILRDSVLLDNCQLLYPTKYGYISVLSYTKEGGISLDKMAEELSSLVQVESEYQYIEPQKKTFDLKQILISVGIGVVVFLIIMFFPKFKKHS